MASFTKEMVGGVKTDTFNPGTHEIMANVDDLKGLILGVGRASFEPTGHVKRGVARKQAFLCSGWGCRWDQCHGTCIRFLHCNHTALQMAPAEKARP
jgi:hypothetical protein